MVRRALSFGKTVTMMALVLTSGCASTHKALDISAGAAALAKMEPIESMVPDSAIEAEALKRFNSFYEEYSAAAIQAGVRGLYAENAWFGDPFHVVEGIAAIEHYFLVMAEPVESCTFKVDSMQRSGKDYYARWTMRLVSKAAKDEPIEAIGISHVRFNTEGKIIFQQDYWDTSAMFDRLPVVGFWTRLVKNKIAKGLEQ